MSTTSNGRDPAATKKKTKGGTARKKTAGATSGRKKAARKKKTAARMSTAKKRTTTTARKKTTAVKTSDRRAGAKTPPPARGAAAPATPSVVASDHAPLHRLERFGASSEGMPGDEGRPAPRRAVDASRDQGGVAPGPGMHFALWVERIRELSRSVADRLQSLSDAA